MDWSPRLISILATLLSATLAGGCGSSVRSPTTPAATIANALLVEVNRGSLGCQLAGVVCTMSLTGQNVGTGCAADVAGDEFFEFSFSAPSDALNSSISLRTEFSWTNVRCP